MTHSIARGPAPRYDYFENSFSTAEVTKLAGVIIAALRAGGWPYETFELKKEGVKRIILGDEKAPPAIWRYLCTGIERLSAVAPAKQNVEETKRSKK